MNLTTFWFSLRTWTELPKMPSSRSMHACGLVERDGYKEIVVAGGKDFVRWPDADYDPVKTVEILNLKTMKWRTAGMCECSQTPIVSKSFFYFKLTPCPSPYGRPASSQ